MRSSGIAGQTGSAASVLASLSRHQNRMARSVVASAGSSENSVAVASSSAATCDVVPPPSPAAA